MLFPGGEGNYYSYGQQIINKLKELNDAGQFYPAWGTCLGFHRMLCWAADAGPDILDPYDAYHISLPIEFVVDLETTKMFGPLGSDA